MNLTKLPKELVYRYKTSIDDFDIDDDSTVDGIVYSHLVSFPLIVPRGWDKEKLILTMFNDAYYLTNIIIIDNRILLHIHSWVEYFQNQWDDDQIVSAIFGVVEFYLRNTNDLPNHISLLLPKLLMECYSCLDWKNRSIISFGKQLKPTQPLPSDHFQNVNINNELLRYHTFKGSVDWGAVTNNFEINEIVRVVSVLGKNVIDQRLLLNDIISIYNSSDQSKDYDHYQMMNILKDTLDKEGILLTKKQLSEKKKNNEELFEEISAKLFDLGNATMYATFDKNGKPCVISNRSKHSRSTEENKEIEALRMEIDKWKKAYENELKKNDCNEPEYAFNGVTNNKCFTKAKMGLLIYTIASISDGPIPVKKNLAPIISAITGFQQISVERAIAYAGFKKQDIDAVADLFQEAMPNFAAEIRKQVIKSANKRK